MNDFDRCNVNPGEEALLDMHRCYWICKRQPIKIDAKKPIQIAELEEHVNRVRSNKRRMKNSPFCKTLHKEAMRYLGANHVKAAMSMLNGEKVPLELMMTPAACLLLPVSYWSQILLGLTVGDDTHYDAMYKLFYAITTNISNIDQVYVARYIEAVLLVKVFYALSSLGSAEYVNMAKAPPAANWFAIWFGQTPPRLKRPMLALIQICNQAFYILERLDSIQNKKPRPSMLSFEKEEEEEEEKEIPDKQPVSKINDFRYANETAEPTIPKQKDVVMSTGIFRPKSPARRKLFP